ncbi:MAG: ATP-binding cassette domain-containing protein [Deltaproteobacteria bacterium]|nr:ATP-binding cassette domain-containing protein [Deltaproteobacteria bacterium]
MITLDSLSCSRAPTLEGLSLTLGPGELPAIVGAEAEERAALVELLAGYRSESAGSFILDGHEIPARERRNRVVVLPHKAALTPELTVAEHLRLLARLRGARLDGAVQDKLLAFSKIDKASRRPSDLEFDQRLRLTLGLSVVGRPALVIALDPPTDVGELMPELSAPDRALLLVTDKLQGLEAQVTRVHGLQHGRLSDGITSADSEPGERAFVLRVAPGGPPLETVLATQAGVTVDGLGEGLYRLRVLREVAVAPLIRTLVSRGVTLEAVTPMGERTASRL